MKKIAALLITISVFTFGYSQEKTREKKKNDTKVIKLDTKVFAKRKDSKFLYIRAIGPQDFHPKYKDVYYRKNHYARASPLKISHIQYAPVQNLFNSSNKKYFIKIDGTVKGEDKPNVSFWWYFDSIDRYKDVIYLLENRNKGVLLLSGESGSLQGGVALFPLGFPEYLHVKE